MTRILPCVDCELIRPTRDGLCDSCRLVRTDEDRNQRVAYEYSVDVLDVGVPRGQGESWDELAQRLRDDQGDQ